MQLYTIGRKYYSSFTYVHFYNFGIRWKAVTLFFFTTYQPLQDHYLSAVFANNKVTRPRVAR